MSENIYQLEIQLNCLVKVDKETIQSPFGRAHLRLAPSHMTQCVLKQPLRGNFRSGVCFLLYILTLPLQTDTLFYLYKITIMATCIGFDIKLTFMETLIIITGKGKSCWMSKN